MIGSRKVKLLTSVLFVIVIGITAGVLMVFNSRVKSTLNNERVLGQTDITSVPYIISTAPLVGYVGVEYVYDVKFTDNDSSNEKIVVSLQNAPDWMHIDGLHIYGTPYTGSEGQSKFEVKISDGENSSVQENYFLIKANEE